MFYFVFISRAPVPVWPLAREANIPARHKTAKTAKATLALRRNPKEFCGSITTLPMIVAIMIIVIPILRVCPMVRMVVVKEPATE